MAEDVASLSLRVDSSMVVAGKTALDKLATAGARAERKAKTLGSEFNGLKKRTGDLVNKFAKLQYLIAATFVGAIIKQGITTVATFQQSIADLSAITGAAGRNLEFLSRASKEFGATTTLSASQVAEAFKLVASAKPDLLDNASALKEVTRQTITLAEAASIDAASAANVLGLSLNQFGEGADQASRFVNVLAAGAKFGASEITDTASAIAKAGVAARSSNVPFEELNAAIQILAANGQKAEIAGTGLKGVLLKLTTQGNTDFNPSIVGMTKAFENLSKAGLNSEQQLKLFGLEGITVAQILMRQSADISIMTDKLTGTNTALEQASIKTNTLSGDAKGLGSALEGLTITMLGAFTPAFREVVQLMTAGTRFANDFAQVGLATINLGMLTLAKGVFNVISGLKQMYALFTQGDINTAIDENARRQAVLNEMINEQFNNVQKVFDQNEAILFQTKEQTKAILEQADAQRTLTDEERKELKKRQRNEEIASAAILQGRFDIAQESSALLKQVAGGNKAALIAALAIEKAIAVSRIMINFEIAKSAALAVGPAGIPLVAALEGQKFASLALVAASGIAEAAQIQGQAHDGMSDVPKTGTFILQKGERVVSREDNRVLTKALSSGNFGGANITVNVDASGTNDAEVIRRAAELGTKNALRAMTEDARRGGPVSTAIRRNG